MQIIVNMLAISTICFYTDKECIFPRYFQCDHLLLKEGNGNPLQYSCLENSVDGGTWWVAVHGVVQSWTRLKRLSMSACIGEGIDNPLQFCCLENPRDGGAWWAGVCGVIQSWTWLSYLAAAAAPPAESLGAGFRPLPVCLYRTLGCTLRSSWISSGPDHHVATEIGNIVLPVEMFNDTDAFSFLMCVKCGAQWWFLFQEIYILAPIGRWAPIQRWETLHVCDLCLLGGQP